MGQKSKLELHYPIIRVSTPGLHSQETKSNMESALNYIYRRWAGALVLVMFLFLSGVSPGFYI